MKLGILRKMFGGGNRNPVSPFIIRENQSLYDANSSTQLQLFGNCEYFRLSLFFKFLFEYLLDDSVSPHFYKILFLTKECLFFFSTLCEYISRFYNFTIP